MNKLPNDVIGIVYDYLSYQDTKKVEKLKILPNVFYTETNKDFKIQRMDTEITRLMRVLKNYKAHSLIACCNNVNCSKVDILHHQNNRKSLNNTLSRCNCSRLEFYCEDCHPTMSNCTRCRAPPLSGCKNCDLFYCSLCRNTMCEYCSGDMRGVCSGCGSSMCESCIGIFRGRELYDFLCKNCALVPEN